MSESSPSSGRLVLSKRTFGHQEALANEGDQPQGDPQSSRRHSARVSFSNLPRSSGFLHRWRNGANQGGDVPPSPKPDRPPIPSALQPPPELHATPLPTLSMIVLSITMLGEFLCANVSAPFLLFMVEGFHQFQDEASVGYWTGILVSAFFLTQFLTSLLWATVAAKHGSRTVIFVALLGTSVTCCLFGTSTSIQQAIAVRLMQGVFAGAIGVARGSVTGITDQSNEGRAYAILGFCWGLGGVSGAIVGGSFENPAKKWPNVFTSIPLFVTYPYLLPCAVAASITFTGSLLSLFLGPDCGPREGAIRLPPEKDDDPAQVSEESRPVTPILDEPQERGLIRKVSKRLSGYFAKRVHDAHEPPLAPEPPVPLSTAPGKSRTFSRTSRVTGSAYGYTGAYRNRLSSNVTLGTRRGSTATLPARRRRESNLDGMPSSVATGSELNFAQRLLFANENAVSNIADLWVAAAMNVDNEDPFESDTEIPEEAVAEDGELDEADMFHTSTPPSHVNRFVRRTSGPASASRSSLARSVSSGIVRAPLGSRRASSTQRHFSTGAHQLSSPLSQDEETAITPGRRMSTTSMAPIFSHVGVRAPPAVLDAQRLLALSDDVGIGPSDSLTPIHESRQPSQDENASVEALEKEPSLMSQLPILVIIQYGILALHSTTHDQVFYLYLVSKFPIGGLNLNAGNFSQLIALMCLAQIAYQFYFYPNIGPPRGRFSHLAMFRIGSLLYIPAYLSVILYRVFANASDEGSVVLMGALALSTAIRYCGITFSYTAVSVLLNYMSPPHLVGYANGIAQSIVSLARFCGPILGGLLWSMSVKDSPAGYPLGFLVCSGVCALAVVGSFLIR